MPVADFAQEISRAVGLKGPPGVGDVDVKVTLILPFFRLVAGLHLDPFVSNESEKLSNEVSPSVPSAMHNKRPADGDVGDVGWDTWEKGWFSPVLSSCMRKRAKVDDAQRSV